MSIIEPKVKMTISENEIIGDGSFAFSNVKNLFDTGELISFSGTFNSIESFFEVGERYNFYADDETCYSLVCTEVLSDGSAKFKPA